MLWLRVHNAPLTFDSADSLFIRPSKHESFSRSNVFLVLLSASSFGLLSPIAYAAAPVGETVALKESILLSSREEIEETAKMLSKVKALQEHINPPYLRGNTSCSKCYARMLVYG